MRERESKSEGVREGQLERERWRAGEGDNTKRDSDISSGEEEREMVGLVWFSLLLLVLLVAVPGEVP